MRTYMCIDLKSFYASVECVERGLDPLTTNLVVADASRTLKTICLAVTPSLKEYGLPGRARLYEVVSKINDINKDRRKKICYRSFTGSSVDKNELNLNHNLKLDYIVAPPRMALYMKYSTDIYNIYLKYLDSKDIYVYSIDEVFCDITNYLNYYNMSACELVTKIIHDVYNCTGITATAGIGTNLYLCKVAMDIVAKKCKPDKNGVRMAYLDVNGYRRLLWNHQPLTDFWRIGSGYLKKLVDNKMYTMGDIARCSIENKNLLYKLFGVNADFLIDHAWGYEPVTLEYVKAYKPSSNSLSSSQVLHEPYNYSKARLIVQEMIEVMSLDLVRKRLVTNQIALTIGYDISNINDNYCGDVSIDRYGRCIPKHSTGRVSLDHYSSSFEILFKYIMNLFDRIIDKDLLVRRVSICLNNVVNENITKHEIHYEQFDIFSNSEDVALKINKNMIRENEEKNLQRVMINIKDKYGKNAVLKGMNLLKGGTTIDRNKQIGGHKA